MFYLGIIVSLWLVLGFIAYVDLWQNEDDIKRLETYIYNTLEPHLSLQRKSPKLVAFIILLLLGGLTFYAVLYGHTSRMYSKIKGEKGVK